MNLKNLCKDKMLSDSGRSIYFREYMNKPHKERACAYENFLRKKPNGSPIFPQGLIDQLIKQSESGN